MLKHQSAKEVLTSFPIKIEMAGFMSDTQTLSRSGWDFSVEQYMNHYGYILRLAMRHRGLGQYAITEEFDATRFVYNTYGGVSMGDYRYMDELRNMVLRVRHIAPEIQFQRVKERGRYDLMAQRFEPVDMAPQMSYLTENISDFKFFRTANPELKDIIVSPDQVPELMDMILKAQKPTQDEIRERNRSRANFDKYGPNANTKPAHEVQCQIITLAV